MMRLIIVFTKTKVFIGFNNVLHFDEKCRDTATPNNNQFTYFRVDLIDFIDEEFEILDFLVRSTTVHFSGKL